MASRPYSVEFTSRAAKDLQKAERADQKRIIKRIEALATNPRPKGCKKLKDSDFYRIRVGACRVIYSIEDRKLVVTIIRARPRRDVYRGLRTTI